MESKALASPLARDDGTQPVEQLLVDLARWLARVTQYSLTHPSCASYGEKAHASLVRALEVDGALAYAISKDGVLMGETPASHRAVLTRIAPHLHARGVQVLRFVSGATALELTALVEALTMQVQTTFDRGGMAKALIDAGVSRITIEEIAHDVDPEEQAAQRRRKELRALFGDALRALRAGRPARLSGEALLELLDHPELALLVLEEDPNAIAEAVAGLCIIVRQEEARSGRELFPKLRSIIMSLSPPSLARALVGLPPLLGNFRSALVWAFDGLSAEDVQRFALPALRAHADDIECVLYAMSIAAAHDGRRLSILRLVGLRLHDLPGADATDGELIAALAKPPFELDSFRRERECLLRDAARALAIRTSLGESAEPRATEELPPLDSRRIMEELVAMAARTPRFARFCERLPIAAARLADDRSVAAIVGILNGLDATDGAANAVAATAIERIATGALTVRVMDELETATSQAIGLPADLLATMKILAPLRAGEIWDRLERSQSEKMQQVLIEALASAGPALLPLVRGKLRSPSWMAICHAITLLPRIGGTPQDVAVASRHPNGKVRAEVTKALRILPPDEATMDVLVSYVTDTSQELREAARAMLRGDLLGARAIETLAELADDTAQQDALRRRCLEVLGRSPRDSAAETLFRLIQPKGLLELGTFREAAAVALRACPAPRAATLFQEGLASSTRRVRKACERAAAGGT